MGIAVYANGMSIACKAADGKSIAAFPDVCFTPPLTPATPPGVPIPYPNTGMASDTTDGSKTVQIGGQEVMLKNKSTFKTSTGDEAGSAPKKNVVTSKIKGELNFCAWSMDVKFEGENVPRHLDLMGHNEACEPSATPPWPYQDAMAMGVEGHPCKEMADDIKGKCSGGSDYSEPCCDARKCFLMPKEPNRCCTGSDGKQMTGHHLLPSKEFVAHADRSKPDAVTKYVSDDAPCLCVEGPSHSKRTEHGQVGCNYTVEKNNWLKNTANRGKTYTLSAGNQVGARSAVGKVKATGCNEKCLTKQLEDGHANLKMTIGPNDPLPRAKQPPSAPMVLD
jgi:hypothetical protein